MSDRHEGRQALADKIRDEHLHGSGRSKFVFKVLVALIAVVAAAAVLWLQFATSGTADSDVAAPQNSTEQFGFLHTSDAAAGRNPVTVTIYEDFLCPSCKVFHDETADYLAEQVTAGTIDVEYRPIAFLVNASPDEYTQRASNAAACVADLGGVGAFIAMHDLLLANQPEEGATGLTDDQLTEFAEQAGVADAVSCIADRTFESWAAQALDAAIDADVTSTPTIRVNDVTILRSADGKETMPGLEEVQYAIEQLAE
ncbi:DsbA family protein [Leucobacter albus]|uniref:DsbA family protein n=1 Tax=Leucobacter albus TaxID=272210 RepID=A0ABW3TL54_9MICO